MDRPKIKPNISPKNFDTLEEMLNQLDFYIENGLTQKQSEYLYQNKHKMFYPENHPMYDEYASALQSKVSNNISKTADFDETFKQLTNELKNQNKVTTQDVFEKPQTDIVYEKPVGSPGVNPKYIEAIEKQRLGQNKGLKIIDGEGGYSTAPALAEMALLFGAEKAASVPELNPGEDEIMMKINQLNKQKYLQSLKQP